MKIFYVYILAKYKNGALYIGTTNDINRRIFEHQENRVIFTARYSIKQLVHVEQFATMTGAIDREKQLKKWKRQWKIDLIYEHNPSWTDLSQTLL